MTCIASRLVCCIVSGGKVLADGKNSNSTNEVKIPFGSEYGIYFKNLHSERCLISVSIDGKDMLNGQRIVIRPNEVHTLEGELTASAVKNKFKFIEKTAQISKFRGDKAEDGLIQIKFQYEEKAPVPTYGHCVFPSPWEPRHILRGTPRRINGGFNDNDMVYPQGTIGDMVHETKTSTTMYSAEVPMNSTNCANTEPVKFSMRSMTKSVPKSDAGITVKGADTNVDYQTTRIGRLETEVKTYIVRLSGYDVNDAPLVAPVSVKTKKQCPTCGKMHKHHVNFCNGCGTNIK